MFDPRYVALAETLLDIGWSPDKHLAFLRKITKRNSVAYDQLASRIHDHLPCVPSRIQLLKLFYDSPGQLKGLSWKRFEMQRFKVQVSVNEMRAPCSADLVKQIPPIPSFTYAAEHLFGLPPAVVDWLANPRVDHYAIKAIAKRGRGNVRILEQPKFRLKTAQRDILREILRFVPIHPSAHGFVRTRSVRTFAEPHVGREIVVRMDLKNFFPSITAQRVSAVFRSLGYPYAVVRLLTDLCTTTSRLDCLSELTNLQPHARIELENLYSNPHLPQGAPTSPALANLVAWRLDARLSGLARAAGGVYTRYADDLLFSGGQDLRSAQRFISQVMAIALDEGFQVHLHKTRVMPKSQRQQAAGVVLNRCPNAIRTRYDNLKATLTNCMRRGCQSQNHQQRPDFRAHLLGQISWIHHLNPNRARKLFALFEQIDWRS